MNIFLRHFSKNAIFYENDANSTRKKIAYANFTTYGNCWQKTESNEFFGLQATFCFIISFVFTFFIVQKVALL